MELPNNQYINIEQAANLLGWYPQKIQYYFKPNKDTPPHTIQGGHKLFLPQALLEWKANLRDGRKSPRKRKNNV